MKHFVAYHSKNVMKEELKLSKKRMSFLSNKRRSDLDNAIGEKELEKLAKPKESS